MSHVNHPTSDPEGIGSTQSSTGGDESFFRYTSGRWIYNEERRLSERYLRFNVDELKRAAVECTGHVSCTSIRKLAEGGASKVFLLTMEDGFEVVAKLPTPIAGPAHYLTSSEVATMEFLRQELSFPVPRIYGWNSSSSPTTNPVGAEYIIMERVQGVELSLCWKTLNRKERLMIIKRLCEYEGKLFTTTFSHYGSLYYRTDLSPEQQTPLGERWCVGPTADPSFWHGERQALDLKRGPWETVEDYLWSISAREREWNLKFAKPTRRNLLFSKSETEILPGEHLQLLQYYDSLVPYLAPHQETAAILRHPDLHLGNVFIDSDSKQIVGIIDWQGAKIIPLFMHTGYPPMVNNDGKRLSNPLVAPRLPDYTNLDGPQQDLAQYTYIQQLAYHLYTAATGACNPVHFRALKRPYLPIRRDLVKQAGYPWDGELLSLRGALINIAQLWQHLTDDSSLPCPVRFTDDEINQNNKEKAEWDEACSDLSDLRDMLGLDEQGWVTVEMFEEAVKENEKLRKELVLQADVNERDEAWRSWPFKDDNDMSRWDGHTGGETGQPESD